MGGYYMYAYPMQEVDTEEGGGPKYVRTLQ